MTLPALILPRTALRFSEVKALAPLCSPLLVVEPPSLEPVAYAPELLDSGLIKVLRPPDPVDQAQLKRVAAMKSQWEQWRERMRGSGALEALKSGILLEEDQEGSLGNIRRDIRRYGREVMDQGLPPQDRADLLLHLAHLQDAEGAELEELLSGVEGFSQNLAAVMGLTAEDAEPADYLQAGLDRLPPLDYSLPGGEQLQARLSAWATLAGPLAGPDARLATSQPAAAAWLMETANRRLGPQGGLEERSPAGASRIDPLALTPNPDTPLAQEAFALQMPDLSALDLAGLSGLHAGLREGGELERLRAEMGAILGRLAGEDWNRDQRDALAQAAGDLAGRWREAVAATGLADSGRTRAWRVLAFPGLKREDLFTMMRRGDAGGLPGPEQWAGGKPKGACPLILA